MIEGIHGIMTSYKHKGLPLGIVAGLPWAGDNCAFTGFDAQRFTDWMKRMTPYRSTCLFVSVPDVVGDASETLERYAVWSQIMEGWPLAYVGQDGSEEYEIPPSASALFVGGNTEWKIGEGAREVIGKAQRMGMHIHIGRVNWWKRYRHFRLMEGSDEFTCDGTRTRFDGVERTLEAWREYEERTP